MFASPLNLRWQQTQETFLQRRQDPFCVPVIDCGLCWWVCVFVFTCLFFPTVLRWNGPRKMHLGSTCRTKRCSSPKQRTDWMETAKFSTFWSFLDFPPIRLSRTLRLLGGISIWPLVFFWVTLQGLQNKLMNHRLGGWMGTTCSEGSMQDLINFRDIGDLLTHFNLAAGHWNALTTSVGDFGNDIRILAKFPRTGLMAGISQTTFADGSPLNPVQATQIGLVWRLARKVIAHRSSMMETEFLDIDPWQEVQPQDQARQPSTSSGVKEKILKMSALIDQSDDTELVPPNANEVNVVAKLPHHHGRNAWRGRGTQSELVGSFVKKGSYWLAKEWWGPRRAGRSWGCGGLEEDSRSTWSVRYQVETVPDSDGERPSKGLARQRGKRRVAGRPRGRSHLRGRHPWRSRSTALRRDLPRWSRRMTTDCVWEVWGTPQRVWSASHNWQGWERRTGSCGKSS